MNFSDKETTLHTHTFFLLSHYCNQYLGAQTRTWAEERKGRDRRVILTCPRISSLSWKLIQGARQTPYTLCRFLPIQSSNFVLLCFLLIYDSFVCCLSRLSEIIVLAPHQRWLKKLGGWFSTFTLTPSARLPIPKPGHSQPQAWPLRLQPPHQQ